VNSTPAKMTTENYRWYRRNKKKWTTKRANCQPTTSDNTKLLLHNVYFL